MTTKGEPNLVDLAIRFDTEELDGGDCIYFAQLLIKSGLVNSTGTYQRFVTDIFNAGYITSGGQITDAGFDIILEGV